MPLDEQRQANLDGWDQRAQVHAESKFYDLQRYIDTPDHLSSTVEFDRTELGDVSGKSLLHLQCHIGTDTISWARLGAAVTGADFSPASVEQARKLSRESGTPARFEVAELYDTPNVIDEQFDIVYTGVGALTWLPDIKGWAKVVSQMLKPGGTFYIRDGHPMAGAIDDGRDDELLVVDYQYFETEEGMQFEGDGTYTDGPPISQRVHYEWNHGLGEIVTALINNSLRIELLHEHTFAEFKAFPACIHVGDGRWQLRDRNERLPLMFSIRAAKTT